MISIEEAEQLRYQMSKSTMNTPIVKLLCFVGGGYLGTISYLKARSYQDPPSIRRTPSLKSPSEERSAKLTKRERRFVEFASAEYAGKIYMTPRDFLESVLEHEPKPCLRRKILTSDEVSHYHSEVRSVQDSSSDFFRKLSNCGIISFADYLFLLSVLTRTESGFRIAFDMFDRDGNQRIDQAEFRVIRSILGRTLEQRKADEDTRKTLIRLMPKSNGLVVQRDSQASDGDNIAVTTTLQIHFFGRKGADTLSYSDFHRFMINLQQEVLQIEFGRYAKGRAYVSDEEFAYILLNYSRLKPREYETYLQRVRNLEHRHQVTYEDFECFCRVLHNLDDFAVAMRFFYSVKKAISKEEFARAVRICSGSAALDSHVIDVVFALFDEDCDGFISYGEFMIMMRNKLRFRYGNKLDRWNEFRRCYRQEMKFSSVN